MNKITKLFLFIFLFSYSLNAQLVVGESGSIEVKNGASVEVAGLEISPAADYVINGSTSVTGDLSPLTINGAESMDRHYDIVAPLSDFIGTIVFNYNEEDMNGISHIADLQVVDSEGGTWMNYADMDDTDFSVTHTFESSVNIHSVTASAVMSGITEFPFCSSFDADLDDWTAESVSGSANWSSAASNYNGSVTPLTGAGMAYIYSSSSVANLVSPAMDISGVANPRVTFSYAQPSWAGDQDELRVWYKAAAGDEWTQLAEYTSSVTAWEGVELALPNASADYYIAFNGTAGYGYGLTIDDVCVEATPTDPGMEVSATTDGGSATFTFDITNFTVGAAAGEGDGHIHYSLNGGTEVMVYSTDPLTLSDLPNGDHTIVFSLVDANHAPLDPAVEATVEFSTFDGVVACDGSYSYTYGNNEDPANVIFTSVNEGGTVTVTVTGSTENNYDDLVVTNGAGEVLYSASGDHTGQAITSNDGTINVAIDSDGSVSGYTLDFAVTCGVLQTAVTFTVNTANITVGENGMYVGGGVLGNALAYAMTDDDGDGTWEVTVNLDQGTTGNYVFLNSPANGDDWGAKEVLDGQECADPNNWNDRILPEITGDAMTIQHCFGSCESDGTCPVPPAAYNVTFSVDTSNYPGGLGESDIIYLNGNFVGWCGECNPMSDDDGDGIWTVTMELEDGDYEYKFTVNGWTVQEEFGAIGAVEGCTVTDGTYTNRAVTVAGEDMVLPTVYWNLCPGETPGEVYNVTFNLDATAIDVGGNGMYMGGGILGGANAVAMSDDDGDGIWTVTIPISTDQIGGNYTFLNSPNDGGDWGAKEDISGQECADADNYNDRIVPEFSGDAEFCYVFAVCTDGVCADDPVTFPICEDFEGEDGAAGWTFIDAGGATSDWLLDTPANTGDQSIGHGYLPQDVAYNDWAVSPSYNTSGLAEGTATVSYYEYLNWSADAQAHNVYYTLDYAGDATTATWVLLTDVIGTDAEDVFVQRTFNIPSAESVVIGFQYLNTYGADWNIDDMCIDGTLSTTDTELLDMRIYPNPTSSMINVQFDRDIELTLYNMLGQEIMRTNNKQVDISALQQGNYIVIVRDLESNYVKNFNVIKK